MNVRLISPSGGRASYQRFLPALLVCLAGCTTPALDSGRVLNTWIQLGAGGSATLRAVVRSDSTCPPVTIDRADYPMQLRAGVTSGADSDSAPESHATPTSGLGENPPSNPAFNPNFDVVSCELALPASAGEVSIDGRPLVLPKTDVRRIVVLGDTGCRIKVPASGKGDPIQDCVDPQAWPWPKIAAAAARTQPDLVIHVGD